MTVRTKQAAEGPQTCSIEGPPQTWVALRTFTAWQKRGRPVGTWPNTQRRARYVSYHLELDGCHTMAGKRSPKQRITNEQLAEIVRLRLRGVHVRDVAKQVGVNPQTVVTRYAEYLEESAAERAESLEALRAEAVQRAEVAVVAALTAYEQSVIDEKPSSRFLDTYVRACQALAKLHGVEISKTELTGANGGPLSVEDARSSLLAKLTAMAPKT